MRPLHSRLWLPLSLVLVVGLASAWNAARLGDGGSPEAAGWLAGGAVLAAFLVAASGAAAVRAEADARRRAELALQRSEERHRLAERATDDGIWDWDVTTNAVYFSPRWKEMIGYADEELPNRFEEWTARLHPDDQERAYHVLREYQQGRTKAYEWEHRLRHRDGTYRWVLSRASGVRDESGRLVRLVGTHTDVTERKTAQAELEKARAQAEAASKAKSEFLANMSHEIRTPMTAILGYADVLAEGMAWRRPGDERAVAVQTIKRNAEHLLEIINDILDLSKVEAGKLEVESVVCDPGQVVADVVALMRVRADGKGLPLSVEYRGSIPTAVRTDPTRLRQILINLLGNAIKFTEVGSVALRVRLDEQAAGGPWLEFQIADTGIGIGASKMVKLFQPFSQGDSSTRRRFGGTGLGLAITKRFAELLGGTINVDSTPGEGSVFTFRFPTGPLGDVRKVDRPSESRRGLADTPPMPAETPPPLRAKVLLAEDGLDNQRLIAFHLRKAGLEVTVAENGRLAVDLALAAERSGEPFDLVLMDMQMPVLDGYDATRELRRAGFARPVIALTAHAMAGDREKCLEAGCDDYATKPIDRRVLIAKVTDQVRRTDRRAAAAPGS